MGEVNGVIDQNQQLNDNGYVNAQDFALSGKNPSPCITAGNLDAVQAAATIAKATAEAEIDVLPNLATGGITTPETILETATGEGAITAEGEKAISIVGENTITTASENAVTFASENAITTFGENAGTEVVNPLLSPGPYAGESIPAQSAAQVFNQAERESINDIGYDTCCHSCGTLDPGTKSGNFVPDHQPVSSLNSANAPQQLYLNALVVVSSKDWQRPAH